MRARRSTAATKKDRHRTVAGVEQHEDSLASRRLASVVLGHALRGHLASEDPRAHPRGEPDFDTTVSTDTEADDSVSGLTGVGDSWFAAGCCGLGWELFAGCGFVHSREPYLLSDTGSKWVRLRLVQSGAAT